MRWLTVQTCSTGGSIGESDGARAQGRAARLTEMVDDRLTRFVWLRQFEVGGNSAAAVRLLERLEFLQDIEFSPVVLSDVPPHRITRLATGAIAPSQLLRKFASYPRQHDLATALREIGRVERTLFIIDWVLDPDMRRRAHIGLNNAASSPAPSRPGRCTCSSSPWATRRG